MYKNEFLEEASLKTATKNENTKIPDYFKSKSDTTANNSDFHI